VCFPRLRTNETVHIQPLVTVLDAHNWTLSFPCLDAPQDGLEANTMLIHAPEFNFRLGMGRKRYPKNWKALAIACKHGAGWLYEQCGEAQLTLKVSKRTGQVNPMYLHDVACIGSSWYIHEGSLHRSLFPFTRHLAMEWCLICSWFSISVPRAHTIKRRSVQQRWQQTGWIRSHRPRQYSTRPQQ
jgi:hypothetical protein